MSSPPRSEPRTPKLPLRMAARAMRALAAMPLPLAARLAGPPQRSDRGDPLDPQLALLLRIHALLPDPGFADTAVYARRRSARMTSPLVAPPAPPVRREALTLAGLPARRYDPGAQAPAPALLFFHGGGFVIGDLDTHDAVCATLAARSGRVVIAVAYRLAPEHRFPAPLDDALAAWRALHAQAAALGLAPDHIAVGGDSAGANLATVLCRLARDAGAPLPRAQLLIYPATDMTCALPSHRSLAAGYYLDAPTIAWFLRQYLPTPDAATDPRASPLFADDLRGLPPAHVVIAGFDPLRDECERYADRLAEAGVAVTRQHEPTLIHGFVNMSGFSRAAHEALLRTSDALARLTA